MLVSLPFLRRVAICGGGCLLVGCYPKTERPEQQPPAVVTEGPPTFVETDGQVPVKVVEVPDHSVLSVTPGHGTHLGGNSVLVRGNGFGSDVRVWFGDAEVPPAEIVAVDAQRVQVSVPAGAGGAVDVRTQNGSDPDTSATLKDGYRYDTFLVIPERGPTAGGTTVTLRGLGTNWTEASQVLIGLLPCDVTDVTDIADTSEAASGDAGAPRQTEQELRCVTAASSAGSKTVTVVNADGSVDQVVGAFRYSNTIEVIRGGLDGARLTDELTVIAIDEVTGAAVSGVAVILGQGADVLEPEFTDAEGVARFRQPDLGPVQTVTLASECYHPTTFIDVPVHQVVAFLEPTGIPECTPEGDPPATSTTEIAPGATITGQLVWPADGEFLNTGWSNIPMTQSPGEERVAYVFELSPSSSAPFVLPRRTQAVTEADLRRPGYSFVHSSGVGNLTLYALAGVENRTLTPPTFTPFALGITRGVAVAPHEVVSDVFIEMSLLLEHQVEFAVERPASRTVRPDRLTTSVSVRVGTEGYLLLPDATRVDSLDEPPGSVLGLPALGPKLRDALYVTTASASTGLSGGLPFSVLREVSTTDTSQTVPLTTFLDIPDLVFPLSNTRWSNLDVELGPATDAATLRIVDVALGSNLMQWRVIAPGATRSFQLPGLGTLSPIPAGPVRILVTDVGLQDFDYGALTYEALAPGSWRAFASAAYSVHR